MEDDIFDLLLRIQETEGEELHSSSIMYEGLYEGDDAKRNWLSFPPRDQRASRAAIRMGLATEEFRRWNAAAPNELVPDGGDYILELTGAGEQRLIEGRRSWWVKSLVQIRDSFPSIVVSVVTALLIGWFMLLLGPDLSIGAGGGLQIDQDSSPPE